MTLATSAMRRSNGPSQITIDASAYVELLLKTSIGLTIARIVASVELVAPDVINLEVMQSLRKLERADKLSSDRATKAVAGLRHSAITMVPTNGLIKDAWSLRANMSAYDACYVALAKALDCPLLTTDAPLQRAARLGVTFLGIS